MVIELSNNDPTLEMLEHALKMIGEHLTSDPSQFWHTMFYELLTLAKKIEEHVDL